MNPIPVRSPSQLAERLPPRAAADLIEWDRSVTPADQFAVLFPDPVDLDTLIANSPNTPALQDDRSVNEYYLYRSRKNAVVVLLLATSAEKFLSTSELSRRSFPFDGAGHVELARRANLRH
jgi:hypothetical protein